MKRLLAVTSMAVAVALNVRAEDVYKIDPAHTTVGFSVAHLVINEVKGRFKDFEGTVTLDDKSANKLTGITGSIQAKSIDTGIEKRDDHLRSADFFAVDKFPTITFTSKRIERRGSKNVVLGTFTMHGVSHDITIPVTVKGPIQDPWGKTRIGLKANLTLDRKDYGLTWNKAMEAGGMMVGEEIEIEINAEAVKQAPETK